VARPLLANVDAIATQNLAGWTQAASQANAKEMKTIQQKMSGFDEAVQKITAFTNEEDGYVATTNSLEQTNGMPRGEVIVELPGKNLDQFLQKVRVLGEPSNQTMAAKDAATACFDTAPPNHARVIRHR